MTITCRKCEKPIRGRAAQEDYNEEKQVMTYCCVACDKKFNRFRNTQTGGLPLWRAGKSGADKKEDKK